MHQRSRTFIARAGGVAGGELRLQRPQEQAALYTFHGVRWIIQPIPYSLISSGLFSSRAISFERTHSPSTQQHVPST